MSIGTVIVICVGIIGGVCTLGIVACYMAWRSLMKQINEDTRNWRQ